MQDVQKSIVEHTIEKTNLDLSGLRFYEEIRNNCHSYFIRNESCQMLFALVDTNGDIASFRASKISECDHVFRKNYPDAVRISAFEVMENVGVHFFIGFIKTIKKFPNSEYRRSRIR